MKNKSKLSEMAQQDCCAAKKWAADLEFYKIECTFFRHLIGNYFGRLIAPQYLDQLKLIENELVALEEKRHEIDKMLSEHLIKINLMAKSILREEKEDLMKQHDNLCKLIEDLTTKSREVKKQLFSVIQDVIKEEEFYDP